MNKGPMRHPGGDGGGAGGGIASANASPSVSHRAAIQQQQQQQQQQSAHANAASLTQVSALLLSGGYDNVVKVWDIARNSVVKTFPLMISSTVNRITLHQSRGYFGVASFSNAAVYNIDADQHQAIQLPGHRGNVTGIKFLQLKGLSNSNSALRVVTSCEDGYVRLFDIQYMSIPASIDPHSHHQQPQQQQQPQVQYQPQLINSIASKSKINDCALHINQVILFTADNSGSVYAYHLLDPDWVERQYMPKPDDVVPMRAIALSNDSRFLYAANQSGDLYIWKVVISEMKSNFQVDELDLTPLWHDTPHGPGVYITRLVTSPSDSNVFVTCSSDKSVIVWKFNEKTGQCEQYHKLQNHSMWVWDAVFNSDGKYLLTCSSDKTILLWSIESGRVIREFKGHSKAVIALAFNDAVTPQQQSQQQQQQQQQQHGSIPPSPAPANES